MESIIKQSDGFVLIYSVTDRGSYRWLEKIHKLITDTRCDDHIPLVVVANKIDMSHARVLSQEDGYHISRKMDSPLFEISIADTPGGVVAAMEDVLKQVKLEFSRKAGGPRFALGNVRRVFKKKISRSKSDHIF